MATTRITGIKVNLARLTQHELDALMNMTADRIIDAKYDMEQLRKENQRRRQRQLDLGL